MIVGIEISVSPEARDLLFVGWACRIFENFNGIGPDFKEMDVGACFHFAVISYTAWLYFISILGHRSDQP